MPAPPRYDAFGSGGHADYPESHDGMTKDAQDNLTLAALSYVFFLFILPLGKKDSKFCRFHAKQGIVVFVAWIIVSFLAWIPFIGWAAWLSLLIITVIAIVKTLKGEMWEIPYFADYAKRINL
jgi:uncharacterized membrane protein